MDKVRKALHANRRPGARSWGQIVYVREVGFSTKICPDWSGNFKANLGSVEINLDMLASVLVVG